MSSSNSSRDGASFLVFIIILYFIFSQPQYRTIYDRVMDMSLREVVTAILNTINESMSVDTINDTINDAVNDNGLSDDSTGQGGNADFVVPVLFQGGNYWNQPTDSQQDNNTNTNGSSGQGSPVSSDNTDNDNGDGATNNDGYEGPAQGDVTGTIVPITPTPPTPPTPPAPPAPVDPLDDPSGVQTVSDTAQEEQEIEQDQARDETNDNTPVPFPLFDFAPLGSLFR